ncbi:transcriptional regulator [Yersinia enterocolitica]|nr:transcriptional regulator [Yersinia enterocolitica]
MKAILIPVVAKDVSLAKEPKDDVMNHKVNHAHQRDPRKKW